MVILYFAKTSIVLLVNGS